MGPGQIANDFMIQKHCAINCKHYPFIAGFQRVQLPEAALYPQGREMRSNICEILIQVLPSLKGMFPSNKGLQLNMDPCCKSLGFDHFDQSGS